MSRTKSAGAAFARLLQEHPKNLGWQNARGKIGAFTRALQEFQEELAQHKAAWQARFEIPWPDGDDIAMLLTQAGVDPNYILQGQWTYAEVWPILEGFLLRQNAREIAEPEKPRQILTGWFQITKAVDMAYNGREAIKSLNRRFQGPISSRGKGCQPIVEKTALLTWWNSLAVLQQDLAGQREGQRQIADMKHNYGKAHQVIPEIAGSVKSRRKKPT